jgi:HAE1 family hydrophobic/amphiphilic exporter-1
MKDFEEKKDFPELHEKLSFFGRWAAYFVDRYRIVYLIVIIIAILGIGAAVTLPRELQPEVVLNYGSALTLYPGAAPLEVEQLVTDKLEKSFSSIKDIKKVNSYSGNGYSDITIEFEQGVDIKDKLNEMSEAVNSTISDLPSDAKAPMIQAFETNTGPILIINITGDYDFVTLKGFAEDIQDRLKKESAIQSAKIIGGLEREITVFVDPLKLGNYGLTVEDLQAALVASNISIPGGNAVLDGTDYSIRTIGDLKTVEAIRQVILAEKEGQTLYLKDVATIIDGYKDATSFSRMAEITSGVEATVKPSIAIPVVKKSSADIINTATLVRQIIEEGKGSLYPSDLTVTITADTSHYVKEQLSGVTQNALSGLLLVLVVLFMFIGLSESIIVSAVIPLSILCSLWLMKMFGLTINNITLFSLVLAVGMLVDNGIVIMENIDRLRHKGIPTKEAAVYGTNQVASAVFASMLTTVAAFFPIMLTSGIMGDFIKPIPLTVIFCLVSSFFVAITVTPALCTKVLGGNKRRIKVESRLRQNLKKVLSVVFVTLLTAIAFTESGQIGLLSLGFASVFTAFMVAKVLRKTSTKEEGVIIKHYGRFLESILKSKKKRAMTLVSLLVAFGLSISLIFTGMLKVEMFALEDQETLYVNIQAPKGTPIEVTNAIVSEVEQYLFGFPEIETFVSNIGSGGAESFSFSGAGVDDSTYGRISIDLTSVDDRERTSMDIAEDMRNLLAAVPGAKITVDELESGPPSSSPVEVKIKGSGIEDMTQVARDFEAKLKTIPGTNNVRSSVSEGQSELQVVIDKEKAKRFGVQEAMIGMAVRNAVEGYKATTYRTGVDEIDVVLRTYEGHLTRIEDMKAIPIQNRSGQIIKLGDVADLKLAEGVVGVSREDGERRMAVRADILEGSNAVEVTAAFEEAMKSYAIPEGVKVTYTGEVEDLNITFTEMFINMIVAVVLVYLILAVQFNSLSQPIIILLTLPMAMIGVMPGLYFTGNSFGFVAFIGVVALVGIAVNDAIVLVDYANYLKKQGMNLVEALVETGKSRFIPVMATTITTAGGILPLSIKEKFFQPMGMALVFGLGMASILTLVIIPVLYEMLELSKEKRAAKKAKKEQKGNGGNTHEEVAYTAPSA